MLPRKESGPEPGPAVIARSWFLNDAKDDEGVLIPIAMDPTSWSEEDDASRLVAMLPAASLYPVASVPEAGQA
jgi:hypothetical protein